MIRKFEAIDVKKAMESIKEELGSDTLIFSTRKLRRKQDVFGLLGREMVEVVACNSRDTFGMSLKGPLFTLYHELLAQGVEEGLAKRLIKNLRASLQPQHLREERWARLFLAEQMMKMIPRPSPAVLSGFKPRVIVMVGPTGVGKTTTSVKLAALETFQGSKSVALITSDVERIGAVEQMTSFARAIGVPVEVVVNKKELLRAIAKHRKRDVVIVDTAGRNQHANGWVNELKELLPVEFPIEIHLVLNATTRDDELRRTIYRFMALSVNRLLFCKLDESATFGVIFNQTVYFRLPLSYFATGQRVPNDIERATKVRLVDLILKLSYGEG